MKTVAQEILGEHDFSSFCKYDAEVNHYRCTVVKSEWTETPAMLIYEVRANRFLHGMVRALVGTMVDVGRGYTPAADVPGDPGKERPPQGRNGGSAARAVP